MTPEDVAAIRAEHRHYETIAGLWICGDCDERPCQSTALCIALEAAWEDIEVSGNNWARNHALMRERAEKAEVEVQRRNEAIIAWQGYYEEAVIERGLVRERAERATVAAREALEDLRRADAALARVRALTGVQYADWGMSVATRVVTVAEIRAAIEGDNQ